MLSHASAAGAQYIASVPAVTTQVAVVYCVLHHRSASRRIHKVIGGPVPTTQQPEAREVHIGGTVASRQDV